MAIGTVKFFDLAKGFGFIVPEAGGKDVFVHRTAVERAGMSDLAQGLNVSFETELDSKGAVQAAKLELRPQAQCPSLRILDLRHVLPGGVRERSMVMRAMMTRVKLSLQPITLPKRDRADNQSDGTNRENGSVTTTGIVNLREMQAMMP